MRCCDCISDLLNAASAPLPTPQSVCHSGGAGGGGCDLWVGSFGLALSLLGRHLPAHNTRARERHTGEEHTQRSNERAHLCCGPFVYPSPCACRLGRTATQRLRRPARPSQAHGVAAAAVGAPRRGATTASAAASVALVCSRLQHLFALHPWVPSRWPARHGQAARRAEPQRGVA